MANLFVFEWGVDPAGYRLEAGDPPSNEPESAAELLSRRDARIVRMSLEDHMYQPYRDTPRLHRIFVEGVTDAESALAFTTQYGRLGSFTGRWWDVEESISHILRCRESLKVLRDLIDKPTRKTSTEVVDFYNQNITPHLTARLWPNDDGKIVMHVVPRSLISWMWLRFGEEITNGITWRACIVCGTPFEVWPDGRYRLKVFCDKAACRAKASRARRKKAEASK